MVAVEVPKLDRLTPHDMPPGMDASAWQRQMSIWQKVMDKIEAAFQEQADQLAAITAAQATADEVLQANAISASWIVPPSVLTATDAGLDVDITVASFTRYYDDGTSVAIAGGTLLLKAYATTYAIYYDDTTRSDTTPNFVATTTLAEARHNYAPGRHYVGTITTPTSGGAGTGGTIYVPPGGGEIA